MIINLFPLFTDCKLSAAQILFFFSCTTGPLQYNKTTKLFLSIKCSKYQMINGVRFYLFIKSF